jgi:DNA-binding NarL/FixJ family response regulator
MTTGVPAPLQIRVATVIESPILRAGVRSYLVQTKQFDLLGEAANGDECIELCAEFMPDLIIVSLPSESDMNFLKVVAKEYPSVYVLSYTGLFSSESEWSASVFESVVPAATLIKSVLPILSIC